jgi:uncharacterized membrane protein
MIISIKELLKITGLPVLFASLCCLSPLIFVLLGVSTVSIASSLADTLYGDYKWWFRGFGLLTLALSLLLYFRSKGICSMNMVKKKRRQILNTVLLSLAVGVAGYMFWLYVVVHYWGVWWGLWS